MKIFAHNPSPLVFDPMWETLVKFASVSQSFPAGITSLLAFTDLGSLYSDLAFVLRNDAAGPNQIQLVVDVSEGGVLPNNERQQTSYVNAGFEGLIVSPRPNPYTYFRVQVNNPGATCAGTWAMLGLRR